LCFFVGGGISGEAFFQWIRTRCQFLDALQHASHCVFYPMSSPVSLVSTLLSDHEADELLCLD